MNNHVLTLLSLLCFTTLALTAQIQQHDAAYQHWLQTHKVIVHFEKNTSFKNKTKVLSAIKSVEVADRHVYLPNTDWVIVRLDKKSGLNVEQVTKQLEALDRVVAVTPYLKIEGVERGILNKVFVKLWNAEDAAILAQMLENVGIVKSYPHRFLKNVQVIEADKYSLFSPLDIAISLHQSGLFEYAEPDYLLNPTVCTDDPLFVNQWPLENTGSDLQWDGTAGADIAASGAWWYTTGDPDIKVAIIDSGVDTNHVDLINNLLPGFDATGGGSKGYPNLNFPNDGHGTACAGIVAASGNNQIGGTGVAYDCSLLPIKVFFYSDTLPGFTIPFSTSDWMASAISWAWQEADADVMSNSWGFPPALLNILPGEPAVVEQAIEEAAIEGRNGKGVAQFFSSGNDGGVPIWPSDLPQTIAVNATSMCDERKYPESCDGEDWWEGHWGDNLDISAPGVKVVTTDMTGSLGYESGDYTLDFNGTSAACPNAAGAAALTLSMQPELTLAQLKNILFSTAEKVGGYNYDSIGTYGAWSPELGYGRVNALEAVVQAFIFSPPTAVADRDLSENEFFIYPNPVQNQLFVKMNLPSTASVQISVFDVKGGFTFFKKMTLLNGAEIVDLSTMARELEAGIYIVEVAIEGQRRSEKILKF